MPELNALQTNDEALEDLEKVFDTKKEVYYEVLGGTTDFTFVQEDDGTEWYGYTGAALAYRLKANDTTQLGIIFGTEGPEDYMKTEGAKLTQWARYIFINEDGSVTDNHDAVACITTVGANGEQTHEVVNYKFEDFTSVDSLDDPSLDSFRIDNGWAKLSAPGDE